MAAAEGEIKYVWELVRPVSSSNGESVAATMDDSALLAELLQKQHGTTAAVKVHLCVSNKGLPGAARLMVHLPFGQYIIDAAGHHYTVVQFEDEVVPNSNKKYLRMDRFVLKDPKTGKSTGMGLDRAQLISSVDGMKIYNGNYSFQLETDGARRAVINTILELWVSVHSEFPFYDELAFGGKFRRINCQGFAQLLVTKIRTWHASPVRRIFFGVKNCSKLTAAAASSKKAITDLAKKIPGLVQDDKGYISGATISVDTTSHGRVEKMPQFT